MKNFAIIPLILLGCLVGVQATVAQVTNPTGGNGTVTSIGGDGVVDSPTPVTTAGNLTPLTQSANTFLAGPTSGNSAAPTFRALVNADFPTSLAPTFSAANLTNLPAAPSVANALTLNNSNTGAASGSTYNGAAAVTLSANTLGAGSLANANTWSAFNTFSNSPGTGAGAYGSLFTFTPQTSSLYNPGVYIKCAGSTDPTFNSSGTMQATNGCSGFVGYLDARYINGVLAYSVNYTGTVTSIAGVVAGASSQFQFSGRSNFSSPSTGLINVGTGSTAGTVGSAAGSGATCSLATGSTNTSGRITVNTGTSTTASATLVTINFNGAPLGAAPLNCSLTNGNVNAAGQVAMIYVTAPSTSSWTIAVAGSPLPASTSGFTWGYGPCV